MPIVQYHVTGIIVNNFSRDMGIVDQQIAEHSRETFRVNICSY